MKKDIISLKDKLVTESGADQVKILNIVKDFPIISNHITWTRQLERKLSEQLQRVQKVLGETWEQH